MTFDYVENERLKPVLDDFTLSEYTEKILQYGFLMVSISLKRLFIKGEDAIIS